EPPPAGLPERGAARGPAVAAAAGLRDADRSGGGRARRLTAGLVTVEHSLPGPVALLADDGAGTGSRRPIVRLMRIATHRLPGMILTDHEFAVPLDHARPDDSRITVFAREVVAPSRERDSLPWLVFFQGGPGGESPRPAERGVWLGR